jgi:hypothetical protein
MADSLVSGGRAVDAPRYTQELAELVRVLLVAGIAVGAVVGGLGSRIAMLVLRLTSPDSVSGIESDDGFTIGQVTLGGTYNLVVIGSVVGVIGAAAYLAVRPWLVGPLWLRRTTVGATAGLLVGAMLIHADGVDFTVLKPLWLAVALFVLLPAAVGVSLALVVDRVAAPGSWTAQDRVRWGLPAVLAVLVAPALIVIVPVLVVVAVLLPVRRALMQPLSASAFGRGAVRAGFALVPILGLLALGQDLGELY